MKSPDFGGKSCRKSGICDFNPTISLSSCYKPIWKGKLVKGFPHFFVKEASWTINLLFYNHRNHHTNLSYNHKSQSTINHSSSQILLYLSSSQIPFRSLTFGRASDSDMGLPCKKNNGSFPSQRWDDNKKNKRYGKTHEGPKEFRSLDWGCYKNTIDGINPAPLGM